MKKKMQFALGAFFALTSTVSSAQKEEALKDTITISPTKDITIMLIGEGLNKIKEQNKFDSLKNLFLADWEQAANNSTYPINAKQTYYFVASNGKRRLKSESEEAQVAIDIEKEKQSVQAGLPAFQYTIFDLVNNYQYNIYLNDPQKLPLLKDFNCNEVLAKTLTDKKMNRKRYRVDIYNKDRQWKAEYLVPERKDFLIISPSIGVSLIGGALSPSIGGSFYTMFGNKRGVPNFKVGLAINGSVLSDYSNLQFKNVYPIGDYEGRFMMNMNKLSQPKEPLWFGFTFGRFDGNGKGDLNKSFKGGFVMQHKGLEYSFTYIKTKNADKDMIYGLSVKFMF